MTIRNQLLLLCSASAFAFAQDKPAAEPVSSSVKSQPAIRRFSAGGVLSFSGLGLIENLSKTEVAGARSTVYTTDSKSSRLGGGVIVQGAVSDRFSVAASALLRRVRFNTTADATEGTKTSKLEDVSSADFWEFPVVLRRYSKSRMESGSRWFGEAGLALRRVRNVRSSLQTTGTDAKVVCCDERPIPVNKTLAAGVAVGAGYQFIDQFGIRFVPGIRYTRWASPTFDRQSTRSSRNQLEAMIAITF